VHGQAEPQQQCRMGLAGPRRAALAGLLIGAVLWNGAALWQLAGAVLMGVPTDATPAPAGAGCTSLSLDRPTGRTLAWPCAEPAWLESARRAARLAAAAGP
jgi:hypothetical protein